MQLIWTTIACICFFALALIGAVQDINERRVPNRLFVAMLALWLVWRIGLLLCVTFSQTADAYVTHKGATYAGHMVDAYAAVAFESLELLVSGIVFGLACLAISTIYERLTGRFSMGGADIKLIAIVPMFLGPVVSLASVFLGCAIGLVFAFGNFLSKGPSRGIPLVAAIAPALPLAALIA